MVKAIARAHRWKRLMESGRFAFVTELAEVDGLMTSLPLIGPCSGCTGPVMLAAAPDNPTPVKFLLPGDLLRTSVIE